MKGRTVTMNLRAKDYTNRVLGVIKEKYGLRDKSEALDKFAEMCGDEFVEEEINGEVYRFCSEEHADVYKHKKEEE